MSDPGELERLIQGYLDETLTDDQARRLREMLEGDPRGLDEFIRAVDLHGTLAGFRGNPALGELLGAAPRPERRSPTRQVPAPASRSYAWIAVAAAGTLLMLALLWKSEPETGAIDPGRARREALQAERARADLERRRAEARLEEIRREREALSANEPRAEDTRKKDLARLETERNRVEREIQESIDRAKKAQEELARTPEVPVEPPKVPDPIPPPASLKTVTGVARLAEVDGDAWVLEKGERKSVQAGQELRSDQGFETGQGHGTIVFPDRTTLEIGSETLLPSIVIEGGKRLFLQKGSLRAQVVKQPQPQPMIFATPYGEAKVLGTTLRLSVDSESRKGARLDVEEGKVEIKNLAGKTALVETGRFAIAASGADLVTGSDPAAQVSRKGLAFWARADQGVTLRGSAVSAWADVSGNNRHAVQPAPAQQPTLIPNAVQGRPAIRFDGVDDCMSFPCPVTRLPGMSIFLVASTPEERTGGVTKAGNAALLWRELENYGLVFLSPFPANVRFGFGTGLPPCIHSYARPASIDRAYSLTTAIKSLAGMVLFVNGRECLRLGGENRPIAKVEDLCWIGQGMGDRSTHRRFPGEVEGESYYMGDIAEILVYSRPLGDSERKAVEQYLLGKYLTK